MISLLLCLALGILAPGDRSHAPSPQERAGGGPITVSAAISLTEALEEIAAAYAKGGRAAVRFNFAGSNVLARQIAHGAPVDLFISADDEQMDVAAKAGALVDGTRVNLIGNQLAVVARQDNVDLMKSSFHKAPPEIRRLAVGDPAAVPAGRYARAYLERQKLWTAYETRIVPMPNVRAALAAVENGAADAAIVYATDVRISKTAVLAFLVPAADSPRIVYPAALVKTSRRGDDARRFLTFLRSSNASAIFHKHGFIPNMD